MLRKAALTVLLLALASSAFASDLRVEGAKSYVSGFLAGNAEVYAASPAVRDDVLFVMRRMTYPLSSWSWAQAFTEDISVSGDEVRLVVSRPDISKFFTGKRPEAVEEWIGFMSVMKSPEVPLVKEEVVLKVNSLGEIEMSREARSQMLEKVTKDFVEGVRWCREHSDPALQEYLKSLQAEAEHVVGFPSDAVREIKAWGDKN